MPVTTGLLGENSGRQPVICDLHGKLSKITQTTLYLTLAVSCSYQPSSVAAFGGISDTVENIG